MVQNLRAAGEEAEGVVQETKEEFWDSWLNELFPALLKHTKLKIQVGKAVLRRDDSAAHKYAQIMKAW
jgi:hypothetical protein